MMLWCMTQDPVLCWLACDVTLVVFCRSLVLAGPLFSGVCVCVCDIMIVVFHSFLDYNSSPLVRCCVFGDITVLIMKLEDVEG